MDKYIDLVIPPKLEKEFRIFFGSRFVGIFKKAVTVLWGEGFSTAREISDLTPEQLKALLALKDLWVIFDQDGNPIGVSKKI
ncbi:MAG: hypothetical protein UW30_C0026G0001 [Candidatus Giovannonibacteria bacterium GW2011_GWA2_44_13b]|uniref:Uncharacterized protein n=1 Tax=Candidatus Giovannonibacteria bacterium GW2011_GWA2_44_13b TaxID=1618647 RepID=A0A0G1J795_9BACT|nr:MAG: hypothetical protein UW30_C0026G0001 [Candidatus Giovannonibacteria bacterium GW2011_GWA2_44_13b]